MDSSNNKELQFASEGNLKCRLLSYLHHFIQYTQYNFEKPDTCKMHTDYSIYLQEQFTKRASKRLDRLYKVPPNSPSEGLQIVARTLHLSSPSGVHFNGLLHTIVNEIKNANSLATGYS
ncbi:hypothetical protein AVEN_161044-1 [Araneus ventricosus]|uniref:Uncharacterized protein n=1 Tax=Araneus ventricosus TaxID=182803 RepID=A0A4Y2E0L9_ARAVE|nr:hypothetical protein AVEN_161044-1 [Araneus ventricosus]